MTGGWAGVAGRLDDLLFEPQAWFPLDRDNRRPRGVVVASREQGLALVASSDLVATFAGRLRPEFVVVDVDLEGEAATALVERLVGWLAARGLWRLVRPSGGAPGRAHVFVRPGAAADALEAFVAALRREGGLARSLVDVRRQVRPLSAPHRTGVRVRPRGPLTPLHQQLLQDPSPAPTREEPASRAGGDLTALVPLARRRRDLPDAWLRYLATGMPPAIGGTDTGPSTETLRLTHELLRAGYGCEEAWATITAAHPAAAAHCRTPGRGRGWWIRHVWNRLVHDDTAWRAEHSTPHLHRSEDVQLRDAVTRAADAVRGAQWSWGPRQRHGIVLVADTILARMLRTGQPLVPIPQRDLVVDTGLSRPTVRAALAALHGVLGHVRETFNPADRETSSHSFELAARFVDEEGLPCPPVSHTPTPQATPAGTWLTLGPVAHSLWRNLDQSASASIAELAQLAGLTHGPDSAPSTDQTRTARRHLTQLAYAGLAHCDDRARWTRRTTAARDFTRRAERAQAPVRARIAAERDEYRTAPGAEWRRQQREAIARERRKARERHTAWHQRLSPAERRARSTEYARRFHAAPPAEQVRLKHLWAQRRRSRLAELDEAARHDAWCQDWSPEAYADRSAERAAVFARLHPAEQAARVAAWQEHRERWRIPLGHPHDRDASRLIDRAGADAA